MTRTTKSLTAVALTLLLAAPAAFAQDAQTLSVPFADPARPGTLRVEQTHGSLEVEGYDGNEVRFEARVRDEEKMEPGTEGLRRWTSQTVQMEVVEENNFMTADLGSSWSKIVDLKIYVPRRTSLHLSCLHSGDIVIRGVVGEHELKNTHGSIEADGVSGSLVAETTHGDVHATFVKVAAGKSMAFSTFHGDVDVTFPPDLRAEVRIDPGNGGDIYTAFDIKRIAEAAEVRRERDGRRVKVTAERGSRGTINGGGPEMRFKTWNGAIYLRKAG